MNESDQENNDNWKLGLFYYNPSDSKVVVPKRYGWSWTFNFARPLAYLLLLAIIGLVFLIRYFIK